LRPDKSEVDRLWCDNSKAKRLLGWEPRVHFGEGLSTTIQWISVHRHLYKTDLYNV
jgi:nucleoside-diphosphate-sugar epimerase